MKNNGIYLHITFACKYRRKCFQDDELKEILSEIIEKTCCYIQLSLINYAIDNNHIHLLMEFDPKMTLSAVICRFKSITSKKWNDLFNQRGFKLWQRSYSVESVSIRGKKDLEKYLKHHNFNR